MSFQSMIQQMLGTPGMNRGLAATFINEAFQKIQNENVWSFQCVTGGWLTPPLLGGSYSGQGQNQSFNAGATYLSPGTITVSPFTNQITGDAVATAAWNNLTTPPLLTQYQIRIPYYSLYSIIAIGNNGTVAYVTIATGGSGQTPGIYSTPILDSAGPGTGATVTITVNANGTVTLTPLVTAVGSGYVSPYISFSHGGTPAVFGVALIAVLTIDRPWMEPAQINASYAAYQAYYALPVGYKRLFNCRDTTNDNPMDFWTYTQIDLANIDAERTVFDEPLYVVPLGIDQRPGSATLGQQLVELWPHPISQLPYTFMCQCNWPALQNPNDTVPYPLTDEIVKFRTYQEISLWKESQKGDDMERGSGANWQFLWKAHQEEYKDDLRQIRIMDRHLMELYFTRAQQTPPPGYQDGYATLTGQLNVGVF
jgi:hypothetical protein